MGQTKGISDTCLEGKATFKLIRSAGGRYYQKCLNCGLSVPHKQYFKLLEQSTGLTRKEANNSYSPVSWQRFCIQLHVIEGLR